MNERLKGAGVFIGLTFFFNYLLAFVFYITGGNYQGVAGLAMAVAYMFIPMTVALVLQKAVYKEPLKELGISWRVNRWWFIGWLLPPVIALATFVVSLVFPGVEYSPEMAGMFERFKALLPPEQVKQMAEQTAAMPIHPIWLALVQGLFAGATINAVAGFGEELGWRGFLQKQLGYLGFWRSSLLIGAVWGIWHAPLVLQGHNYPQHPELGVFMMTIWTLLLAPVFSYITIKSGSVIAAAILHGTLNATYGLAIMLIKGGSDLTVGLTGAAGFIVLIVVNLGIYLFDRFLTHEPVGMLMKRGHGDEKL